MRFEGQVAVVTGAGSGIGFQMARLLAEEGAEVYAGDLDPGGAPDGTIPVTVDVSDPVSVGDLISMAVNGKGRIDQLFNNAGIGSTSDPISCTLDEWERLFAVNCRGVFLGTKYALPHMLQAGSGSIVNTASVAGMIGFKDRAAYCATKGAVIAFTKAVAVQYAGTGVRCNCICPGTVDSPWVERLLQGAEDPKAMKQALIARQPIGRLGRPDEVARAALYLASEEAAFITGTEFVIDGGIVAG